MEREFDSCETPDGYKTILVTHKEQRDFAKIVDKDSLYCLLPSKKGWIVEMVVDSLREADEWWEKQKHARVYYGQNGAIRHSK